MNAPVIMWFRQDLRLADHPALAAATAAGPVIPVFILDDVTPGAWRWGSASRWWLHRSLEMLSEKLPLILRQGKAEDVLTRLLAETGAKGLYFTRDYAPWSGELERKVKAVCDRAHVACHRHGGFLLHEPEMIKTGAGSHFKVYTPFARACMSAGELQPPRQPTAITLFEGKVASDTLSSWSLLPSQPNWAKQMETTWQPGEAGGAKVLQVFLEASLQHYADGRDRPDKNHTSRLSPYLHWGEISPHQVWRTTRQHMDAAHGGLDRNGEKFLKELLWREFSNHLLHHVPHMPEKPFRLEFEAFPWRTDSAALQRWQRGETGYPIVDAGMRELWSTGIMHNRVRMIVASFLVKHLLIPWQEGERWFWDTLVDADIGNNAASWQWVTGCGADAAPYFRIFNPILQGKTFDPDGTYVKHWIPELRNVDASLIHTPWELPVPPKNYPGPIVEHAGARARALAAFKNIKQDEVP